MEVWQFIIDPHNHFIETSLDYIRICCISIILAIIIGVVLAVLVSGSKIAAFLAVNLSGLLRAIPVIVFLIIALPVLHTGEPPVFIALVILGIPPILLNTYTGIHEIDPAIIDAAKGMGMMRWQIIIRIQAPLVLPILAAGVRTAAVQIIATATLGSFVGANGYGRYIFDGINNFKNVEILAGAIPVALLAMMIEVLMGWLQRLVTPAGLRIQALGD